MPLPVMDDWKLRQKWICESLYHISRQRIEDNPESCCESWRTFRICETHTMSNTMWLRPDTAHLSALCRNCARGSTWSTRGFAVIRISVSTGGNFTSIVAVILYLNDRSVFQSYNLVFDDDTTLFELEFAAIAFRISNELYTFLDVSFLLMYPNAVPQWFFVSPAMKSKNALHWKVLYQQL